MSASAALGALLAATLQLLASTVALASPPAPNAVRSTEVALAAANTSTATDASSADDGAQLFARQIAPVLQHPRCLNCHPKVNFPHQGDEARRHDFGVTRGPNNQGAPGLHCSTCHQSFNQAASGVPGAPHWQLAPPSMAWEGLTTGELCRTLLDTTRNGNRDVAALVKHMTSDALVQWAWQPGGRRKPIPISRADFTAALGKWSVAGAPCPQ